MGQAKHNAHLIGRGIYPVIKCKLWPVAMRYPKEIENLRDADLLPGEDYPSLNQTLDWCLRYLTLIALKCPAHWVAKTTATFPITGLDDVPTNKIIKPLFFLQLYESAPHLTLAVMTKALAIVDKCEKSKSGRLLYFMATRGHVRSNQNAEHLKMGMHYSTHHLEDGQFAFGYQKEKGKKGEEFTAQDIQKARKELLRLTAIGAKLH